MTKKKKRLSGKKLLEREYHELMKEMEERNREGRYVPIYAIIRFEALSEYFGRDAEEWLPKNAKETKNDLILSSEQLKRQDEQNELDICINVPYCSIIPYDLSRFDVTRLRKFKKKTENWSIFACEIWDIKLRLVVKNKR